MHVRNIIVALILMLIPISASAGKWELLPDRLVMDPIAQPRSPQSYLQVSTSKYFGEQAVLVDVAIGKDLSLVSYTDSYDNKIQLFVGGGAWSTLGIDNGAYPLLLQDFLAEAGIRMKGNDMFMVIKMNHISAHLGDGMDRMLKKQMGKKKLKKYEEYEALAQQADLHLTLQEPIVYSRDFLSGMYGCEHSMGLLKMRSYVDGGVMTKLYPDTLGNYFVGFGNELEVPVPLAPYYAHDITWNDDVASLDYSGQIGVHLARNKNTDVRAACSYYHGSDRRGQMVGQYIKQISCGFIAQ